MVLCPNLLGRGVFGCPSPCLVQTQLFLFKSGSQVESHVSSPVMTEWIHSSRFVDWHSLLMFSWQTLFQMSFWAWVRRWGMNFAVFFIFKSFFRIVITVNLDKPVQSHMSVKLKCPSSWMIRWMSSMLSGVLLHLGWPDLGASWMFSSPLRNLLCQTRTCVLHIVWFPQTLFKVHQHSIGDCPDFAINFKATCCSPHLVSGGFTKKSISLHSKAQAVNFNRNFMLRNMLPYSQWFRRPGCDWPYCLANLKDLRSLLTSLIASKWRQGT